MFADTKPPALASSVPTLTGSPFFTTAWAGAPICWLNGIMTCLGIASPVIFFPADNLFSGGCIPPIRNVLSILLDFYSFNLFLNEITSESSFAKSDDVFAWDAVVGIASAFGAGVALGVTGFTLSASTAGAASLRGGKFSS